MRKPKHIKNAILKMKKLSVDNRIEKGVRWADELLEDLEKDLTFEEKVRFINEMQELALLLDYELGEPVYCNLFKQSKIQWGLKGKLNKLALKTENVGLAKEIYDLLDFIKNASEFEESWSQDDGRDMIREFRLVSSKEEWQEFINKSKDENVDIFGGKKYEHIKIAHVTNEYWETKVRKYEDKVIQKMGNRKFWSEGYYRYFQIWYNQLIKGTYYIFIPELM